MSFVFHGLVTKQPGSCMKLFGAFRAFGIVILAGLASVSEAAKFPRARVAGSHGDHKKRHKMKHAGHDEKQHASEHDAGAKMSTDEKFGEIQQPLMATQTTTIFTTTNLTSIVSVTPTTNGQSDATSTTTTTTTLVPGTTATTTTTTTVTSTTATTTQCNYDVYDGYPAGDHRRCGSSFGGNDMTSAMCQGATVDGSLNVSELEIERRCNYDQTCAGYGFCTDHGGFYRPVSLIVHVHHPPSPDNGTWTTFIKRCKECDEYHVAYCVCTEWMCMP